MKLFEQLNAQIEKANKSGKEISHMWKLYKEFELIELTQSVSDCAILLASQTLSLSHWNYAKP